MHLEAMRHVDAESTGRTLRSMVVLDGVRLCVGCVRRERERDKQSLFQFLLNLFAVSGVESE